MRHGVVGLLEVLTADGRRIVVDDHELTEKSDEWMNVWIAGFERS